VTIEIRTIEPDELEAYLDASTTAFLERPSDIGAVAASVAPHWDRSRVWAAVDGTRIVATLRSFATELTVPGGRQVAASAIAGVGVMPTHRRRGLLRRLVATEHAAMRERGETFGLLNASEYPIYGRFGYGMGCRWAVWRLDTTATGFHGSTVGTIELAPPDDATLATIIGVYEAVRRNRVGEIRRRDIVWRFQLGLEPEPWGDAWKGFVALHRDPAGRVDGFARYHAESKWEDRRPRNILHVDDLQALDAAAEAELWRFLASIDWVTTLRAERRSPSDRLPWLLTDLRAAVLEEASDGMFVRLHDLAAALEARTYEGEGSLVLEVIDPDAPDRPARIHLETGPDGARCTPTDRGADLTVHLAALSAAYLGGTPLSRIAIAFGGLDEATSGAVARAERVFRTLDDPWSSTYF
jgi:predicted acetyltransferase